ncbi:hypothetical protein C8Q76DRAFT_184305 [Earliella scabrosa]|nr:hypothetical protein C8Q76DRAFT_184305 [Earliella scabrosa]
MYVIRSYETVRCSALVLRGRVLGIDRRMESQGPSSRIFDAYTSMYVYVPATRTSTTIFACGALPNRKPHFQTCDSRGVVITRRSTHPSMAGHLSSPAGVFVLPKSATETAIAPTCDVPALVASRTPTPSPIDIYHLPSPVCFKCVFHRPRFDSVSQPSARMSASSTVAVAAAQPRIL